MTTVDQILANISVILSSVLFIIFLARILKNKERTLNYILDGLLVIGFSGIAIIILCTKSYQADLPMIVILLVLIIKYIKNSSENGVNL